MTPPDRSARSIGRLLLRLWGTRHAPCVDVGTRLTLVWRTTWRHCWPYSRLARQLADTVGQGARFRAAEARGRRRLQPV